MFTEEEKSAVIDTLAEEMNRLEDMVSEDDIPLSDTRYAALASACKKLDPKGSRIWVDDYIGK